MKKPHYGWVICISCTLQLFVTAGVPSTAFGVHLPYIIDAYGFTNAQGSLILTVRTIALIVAMLFIDKYMETFGIRRGLLYASICGACGFFIYSIATAPVLYYVGAVFSGASVGLTSMIPVSILISRWFHSRRAFALSICTAGSGLATIVLPPFLPKVISGTSLSTAFRIEATFILFSSILVFVLLRNFPAEKGLTSYVNESEKKSNIQRTSTYFHLSASGLVWMLLAMFLLGGPGNSISFLSLLYADHGFSEETAAILFSAVGLALTIGKFAMGLITDKIGGFGFHILAYSIFIIGSGACCIILPQTPLITGLSVVCLGVGLTTITIGISYLAEDFSSEETYGSLLRKFHLAHNIGMFVFSYAIGIIADFTNGYTIPFFALTALIVATLLIILVAYRHFRIKV
jgi:MFS family permease